MLKNIIYSFIIGTYGSFIYKVDFNPNAGTLKITDSWEVPNASYVITDGNSIYTFSESGEDSKVYSLTDGILAHTKCPGDNPCFLTISPNKKHLITADYTSGSASVYTLQNGTVGERIQKLSFEGSGPITRRQASPHIHQVKFLPCIPGVEGEWLLAPDLGSDKIRILKYSGETAPLQHTGDITFPAGSGPRHIEFDMQRQMMYCICELSGKVEVFKMTSTQGVPAFEPVQSVLADECNSGGSGDIHIHPHGKYLYTSHRLLNDGIAVFSIMEEGTLKKTGYVPTHEHPRNFLITPCGEYILAAAKNACTIQVFRIGEDGIPVATETVLNLSPDAPTSVILW